ncbi:MAG TPA: 50S ribosomal protein L5 [Acholeplasma sp.]|jgi:large subunit ribosomal protein L5|nr:50S ribosomal protein L5 [Acholeplasma sp.]
MSRLKTHYDEKVRPELMKQFNYSSIMEVPKIEKIVVNMGVGDAIGDPKAMDGAVEDLALLTGQKPIVIRARKSVATFKLREGMPIGAKVTLRGTRMYDFLDKLISVSLPRVRDFRGVSKRAFDGRGNYTLGVREQIIFPEIKIDNVRKVRGMDIVIVTTAKTDEEGKALLTSLGMPFRR